MKVQFYFVVRKKVYIRGNWFFSSCSKSVLYRSTFLHWLLSKIVFCSVEEGEVWEIFRKSCRCFFRNHIFCYWCSGFILYLAYFLFQVISFYVGNYHFYFFSFNFFLFRVTKMSHSDYLLTLYSQSTKQRLDVQYSDHHQVGDLRLYLIYIGLNGEEREAAKFVFNGYLLENETYLINLELPARAVVEVVIPCFMHRRRRSQPPCCPYCRDFHHHGHFTY